MAWTLEKPRRNNPKLALQALVALIAGTSV